MFRTVCMALALGFLALSAQAAPPIEAYGKLPGFERAALSPSGERYAVVGVVGDQRSLLVVEGGKGLLAVNIGERKIRDLQWAGEDKVLVFGSATYALGPMFTSLKYEIEDVTVIDLKTRQAKPLLVKGPAGNGVWGTYGVTQEQGRWYGYFGAITLARSKNGSLYFESGNPDLYRVDLETGREGLHGRGPDGDDSRRSWLVGADGVVLATRDFDKRSGAWTLKSGKNGEPVASGVDPFGGVGIVGQGRTPGTVVYCVTGEDGADRWMEVPLAGGEAVEIAAGESAVDALFDSRTGLMIGYLRDGDMPEPVFFDRARQAKVSGTRKAFPGLNMTLASWNDAFDRLIVETNGVGDSGTWWLVDLRTGKAEDIGRGYPAIKEADVGPMKMVRYKAADGLEMEGVLTLPPGRAPKNLPLVVFPHGGPQTRDYPVFDWWAQAFAARGYAVFQPNFRGSSGYGQAFVDAAQRERGGKMQSDISDGVAELARLGIVDPGRACIMGASHGGYAALAGVTLQQGLYRCAVSVAGLSDLQAYYGHLLDNYGAASPTVRNWREDVGERDDIKAISPAALAARADAPVLLIHGRDDTVVPYDQATTMERALKRADKPVELLTLKGEDHWLSNGETRLQMLRAALAFVERHNPPS